MASKDTKASVKRLHAVIEETEKRNSEIKSDLKKLEITKKEKDAKVLMDTIYNQLDDHLVMHEKTEKEIAELKEELRKKLGKPAPRREESDDSRSPSQNKKMASPEEQVLTYELKSQLLRNVEMQNHRLKTELTLHEKMTEAKLLNQQNRRLADDNSSSKTNTLRLMKMFEKKAKDADGKLKEMQQELNKAQQLARKYHQMYDMERRRNGHPDGADTPDSGISTPRQQTNAASFLGNNVRVNDVIRKNEVLVEENEKLHREILRLKQDNAALIKKCKHAMSDKDGIIHRLDTSEANRRELSKRLEREKTQHQNLSKSLTRQASDWILLKKQLAQFDEEYRWSQMKQQCEEGKQRFGLLPPIYYYMPMRPDNDLDPLYDGDDVSLPSEAGNEPCLTPITEVESCLGSDHD